MTKHHHTTDPSMTCEVIHRTRDSVKVILSQVVGTRLTTTIQTYARAEFDRVWTNKETTA